MLVEADKRGPDFAMPLTYSKNSEEKFYVPENVYIRRTDEHGRSLASHGRLRP